MNRRLLATIVVAATATAALAGPREDAEALNQEGKKLHAARDYPGALAKFRAALALAPESRYWFNLASVLDDMGRRGEAADAYERFLAHPDTQKSGETARWAEKRLREIEPGIAHVIVVTGQAGARVRVIGTSIDVTGAEVTFRLDPGEWVVEAEAGGRGAAARVHVRAGERSTIDLRDELRAPPPAPDAGPVETAPPPDAAPADAAPPDASAVVEAPPAAPRRRVLVRHWYADRWGGGLVAAGALSLGAGVVFYLSSESALDEADGAATAGAHADALDRARSRRTLSQWTLGAGVGLVALGVTRWLVHGDEWADAPPGPQVTIDVNGDGAFVGVGGRF